MSSTAFTSTTMNGQEPPLKRKKLSAEPTTIQSLPDDLVMSCLARVSRLHYRSLSLVSKSFRSLLASPALYRTRTLLGRTETCLYICLQFPPDPNPRWFTLYRKPEHTQTKKRKKKKEENSIGNVLASIRILNSPTMEWSNLVAVGPNLYAISGPIEGAPYSSFSFLNCRTHTWVESPSLRIAHTNSKIDGSMYLPGSCENPDSLNCIEVFNRNSKTWKPVPSGKRIFKPDMEGKIYVDSDGMSGVAFNLKEMTGESVGVETNGRVSVCMIQSITYRYNNSSKVFYWFMRKIQDWRKLEGLEGLPKFAKYSNVRLVGFGGRLLVLWDKYVPAKGGYKKKMIWCAVISLERRNNGKEMWGKVEWCDALLEVPKSYKYVYAIAATL